MGEADRTELVKIHKKADKQFSPLFWGKNSAHMYMALKENHEKYIKPTTNLTYGFGKTL